jgi:hypothetical protein
VIGRLLAPVGYVARALEGIAAVKAVEREMRGLRDDMREVIAGVEGLREDVRSLNGGVGGIREATESLDAKIDDVSVHLQTVGALAARVGRLGARRPRGPGA